MPQHPTDDPDLPLSELFQRWPDCAQVLLARKMGCFGCVIAPFHCVSDACREYGLNEEEFHAALRTASKQGN